MKTAFWLGVVAGFAAILAGAHFYPWVSPERLPSQTSVVANGGRAEQFLIRLPADRIGGYGSADAGLRAVAPPGGIELPAELQADGLLVEEYKVRDRSGSVIGIAARHRVEADGAAASAWLLVIPSRGALMLTAGGERRAAVDRALTASGYRPGEAWNGAVSVTAGDDTGHVRAGSHEFDGLGGRYTETWNITGVDPSGELQGTIELSTVTYRGSSPPSEADSA